MMDWRWHLEQPSLDEIRQLKGAKIYTRKVGVGVIGLGHNGIAFVRGYQRNSLCEVKAICDLSEKKTRTVSEELGIKDTYNDYEILERRDIDLISVHTPDHLHAEPTLRALEAGKHVFVEKPMATTMADLKRMVDAAKKSDGRVMVGHILRFNDHFRMVKRLVNEGTLGRIFYMEGDYMHDLRCQADPMRYNEELGYNWYLEYESPIIGGGIHPFDLLRWFANSNAVEVQAYSNHIAFPAMKHDDCMVAIFRFANDCLAKVTATYGCISPYAHCNHVSVYGTKGTINRDKLCLEGLNDQWVDLPPLYKGGHPYDPEIDHFLKCILEDTQPLVDAVDGANSTAAVIMVEEALKRKGPVSIPQFEW